MFSGNCIFNGTSPHPICIYSNNPCNIGVCATSTDGWVTWSKRPCMPESDAPSKASQTNHDTSIWQDSDTAAWYLLIGGCTYAAPGPGVDPNIPTGSCHGNAQLWTSPDLWNFSYVTAITPGGPGGYWELPYLLPFDDVGNAIDDVHHEQASQYVLAFGHGNAYWVGRYNRSNHSFVPLAVANPGQPTAVATAAAVPSAAATPSTAASSAASLAAGVMAGTEEASLRRRAVTLLPSTDRFPNAVHADDGLVGSWALSKGSGASTAGPAGMATGLDGKDQPRGLDAGALFRRSSLVSIPHFGGVNAPGGFGFSLLLQVPAASEQGRLFTRDADDWGIELWSGGLLNFFVRKSSAAGTTFRAVQGHIGAENAWVRVAGSYNGSAPTGSNIALFAGGAPIKDATTDPGAYAGRITPGSSGLAIGGGGTSRVYIASVSLYNRPLSRSALAGMTAAPKPAPAPVPKPDPAPPGPPPPAPDPSTGWPSPFMSDTGSYCEYRHQRYCGAVWQGLGANLRHNFRCFPPFFDMLSAAW